MTMINDLEGCPNCELTLEDLHNKIYHLELMIEEMEESHSDEVDYLHNYINKLEKELNEIKSNSYKGVF